MLEPEGLRSERAVEAVVAANGLGCGCAQSHSTAQQGLSHASCASEGCLNGDAPLTETLGIQAGGVITPYLIYPQTTDQSEAVAYDTIRGKVVLVPLISGHRHPEKTAIRRAMRSFSDRRSRKRVQQTLFGIDTSDTLSDGN